MRSISINRSPLISPVQKLAVRVADGFLGIPTALANLQEFVNNSHKYTDSTGLRFVGEAVREFFLSIWNHRLYTNNLELAASVSWEEVNAKLPSEYNFRTGRFEFSSQSPDVQARARYELAAERGSIKFPTLTRRQLEIDRDRREAAGLIAGYTARAEAELLRTKNLWNLLFSRVRGRLITEKSLQRLVQYRMVERELNSIVLKHYDTTENDFIASNKVNREVYAKLNASPGYTIGADRTKQSYLKRVDDMATAIAMQIELTPAFALEVDQVITLQATDYAHRGQPIRINRISNELRNICEVKVLEQVLIRYGQCAANTILQWDANKFSCRNLVREINSRVRTGHLSSREIPASDVQSITGW